MVVYNTGINRLDFDWPWLKVKVTRGQMVKIVFANNSVQNCRIESWQKLKHSLFSSLNISKYDYGRRTDSFRVGSCVRSQWNRLYNSLKMQLSTIYTIERECKLSGLPWRRFAHSERLCCRPTADNQLIPLLCNFNTTPCPQTSKPNVFTKIVNKLPSYLHSC